MELDDGLQSIRPSKGTSGGDAATLALTAGTKVGQGRYALERELGRGGMGVVWLAHDTALNDHVALKFLPPEIRRDASALDDLKRETMKSRKLTHPNIIRIHDFCQFEGELPFISMEFVEGTTLASLKVKEEARCFQWDALKVWASQLCAALDYAHGEGVVHRDLKPANIMLDGRGRLKLADFGLAATISDSMGRVSMNMGNSGTPSYMSPQQMDGRPPKATDDVYAFGATFYELLTSKPPFYSGDNNALQKAASTVSTPFDAEEGEGEDEELIEQCIEVIRSEQKASVSLLQRRLKIGYGRAARIMDVLEERGYVGPSKGAEPRDILIDLDGEGHDGAGQQAV